MGKMAFIDLRADGIVLSRKEGHDVLYPENDGGVVAYLFLKDATTQQSGMVRRP